MNCKSKIEGCFYGLFVGDAFGAPAEFKDKGTFPEITEYVSGGKFSLAAGEWTDDGAQALCLAESLAMSKGFNAKHQLDLLLDWLMDGRNTTKGQAIGIGKHTFKALLNYKRTGDLVCPYNEAKHSGNGSIMRIAPILIRFLDIEMAIESSKLTHSSKDVLATVEKMASLIIGYLNGEDKVIPSDIEQYNTSNSGYAPHTLESALYSFYTTNNFREGLIDAVNRGNDADTVGAVYGQIAGAYYGIEGIDKDLLDGLVKKELLDKRFENLIKK